MRFLGLERSQVRCSPVERKSRSAVSLFSQAAESLLQRWTPTIRDFLSFDLSLLIDWLSVPCDSCLGHGSVSFQSTASFTPAASRRQTPNTCIHVQVPTVALPCPSLEFWLISRDMASYTGDRMMLVYEHKTNGRILVSGGLSILDEEGLVLIISASRWKLDTALVSAS